MSEYYWKDDGFDRFVLIGPGIFEIFTTFEKLCRHCAQRNINARQV